jgi:hypothetical protein
MDCEMVTIMPPLLLQCIKTEFLMHRGGSLTRCRPSKITFLVITVGAVLNISMEWIKL